MSLTRLFPQPALLDLAGASYPVSELRVRDLAAIQGWVEARAGDPLDDARTADALADPGARIEGLRAAWRRAGEWPPVFGSPAARALTDTPEYRAFFVWLAVSRADPAFGAKEAVALSARMTADEHIVLSRACWRPDPARAIARMIDPGSAPPGDPLDWEELVAEMVAGMPWACEQVGDMPLSRLFAILRGGKPPRATVDCDLEGEAFAAFMERRRRLFYGDPTANDDGAAEPGP